MRVGGSHEADGRSHEEGFCRVHADDAEIFDQVKCFVPDEAIM